MPDSEKPSVQDALVEVLVTERQRDRRWRQIKTGIWACLILLFIVLLFAGKREGVASSDKPYVSVLRLSGVIMPGSRFSAEKVIPNLDAAFKDKRSRGVVLIINSPGGSPVQASIIHDRILYLKKKYNKAVVVVGRDMLASGAYLVATAADKIFVNRDTVTGSIGVIMSSFGFTNAIQKLGISRRVFIAGENKDRLDPFKPMSAADKEKIKTVLDAVHQGFIQDVVTGRGARLHGDKKVLFSGDFWAGDKATQLGLVDGTSNLWTVMHQVFKVDHFRDYSVKPSFVESLMKGAETRLHLSFGAQSQLALQSKLDNVYLSSR